MIHLGNTNEGKGTTATDRFISAIEFLDCTDRTSITSTEAIAQHAAFSGWRRGS